MVFDTPLVEDRHTRSNNMSPTVLYFNISVFIGFQILIFLS